MAFGLVQIAIGIAAAGVSRSVVTDVLAIAGFSAGLLLGVFCLGVLTRRADQVAAITGLLTGLAALLATRFLGLRFELVVAWPWYALIGAVFTFLGGVVAFTVRATPSPGPPSS